MSIKSDARIKELEAELATAAEHVKTLEASGAKAAAHTKEVEAQLATSAIHVKALEVERRKLQDTIASLSKAPPKGFTTDGTIGLDAFATSVTQLLVKSHAAAENAPGSVSAVLQSVDMEIRGFVQIQGDVPVVAPPRPGDTIDASALSLVRMTFAALPPAVAAPAPPAPPAPPKAATVVPPVNKTAK